MTQIRKEFWEEKEAKENSMAKFYASKNQQYHGKLSSDYRFWAVNDVGLIHLPVL